MIFIAQIPYNFFQVNFTVQSPHKDLGIIGITNFEILSFTNKLLKKIVIHRILNINSGSAKTYFTLVQKRASNQSFDSLTQVLKCWENCAIKFFIFKTLSHTYLEICFCRVYLKLQDQNEKNSF